MELIIWFIVEGFLGYVQTRIVLNKESEVDIFRERKAVSF